MASRCELTGKGKQYGHNVSFSLRRTKRTFKPNLQKVRILVDGKPKKVWVSARALKSGKVERV